MKITDLFITTTPNASLETLERWRNILSKIHDLIWEEEVFNPFTSDVENAISGLDTDIEGARRELEIAEQNAKYREDRPNA